MKIFKLTLIALLLLFGSCNKNESEAGDLILEAKKWIETQDQIKFIPNWDQAITTKVNNQYFVILSQNVPLHAEDTAKSYLVITIPITRKISGNFVEFVNEEGFNVDISKSEIIGNYLSYKANAEFKANQSFNILLFNVKHDFLTGNIVINGKIGGSIALIALHETKIDKLMCDRCRTKKERACSDYYYVLRYVGGPIINETYLYSVCEGGGDGGSGGGGGSTTTAPKDVKNQMKDACLKAMVQAAIDKGIQFTTEHTLNSIFDVGSKVNLTFIQAAFADDGTDGAAVKPTVTLKNDGSINTFNITIRLNEKIMPNAYISATILHEALHAYFAYLDKGIDFNPASQHVAMATDKYISWFEKGIKGMYPEMSDFDLKALAWGGLEKTPAYDVLRKKEPYEVGQMWSANYEYRYGQKGTKCN